MLPVDETVPHDHALTPLEAFLRGVHRQLGADAVAPDEAVRRASANVEGAGHRFAAVVRPRQVQEVQAVLRLATATGQPVLIGKRGQALVQLSPLPQERTAPRPLGLFRAAVKLD